MPELENKIKTIQEKIQQLIRNNDEVAKENQRLKRDIDKLLKQSTHYLQTIEGLKQQVEVLKIGSGNWDDNDKKEFEKRINLYVREIDRAIALLSE